MTNKEMQRLSRAQLIEIIYQFQLQIDQLTEHNRALEQELADKRFRIDNAGNIAEAALEINNCFLSAQNAAEQYLNEIKSIREETEKERKQILAAAQAEADRIIANAQQKQGYYDIAVETILKEYKQRQENDR